MRRPYTDEEKTARGLDEWHADPEMHVANLNARIKLLESAVAQLQLIVMRLQHKEAA